MRRSRSRRVEALERGEHGAVIARLGFDQAGDDEAQLRLIQPAAGLAEPEQAAGGGGGDFGNFHEAGKGETGESAFDLGERVLVDALLVVRGEHLAGDLRGGGGHQAAEFALQLHAQAVAVGLGGGFRFG